jgi:hypothetical protein
MCQTGDVFVRIFCLFINTFPFPACVPRGTASADGVFAPALMRKINRNPDDRTGSHGALEDLQTMHFGLHCKT